MIRPREFLWTAVVAFTTVLWSTTSAQSQQLPCEFVDPSGPVRLTHGQQLTVRIDCTAAGDYTMAQLVGEDVAIEPIAVGPPIFLFSVNVDRFARLGIHRLMFANIHGLKGNAAPVFLTQPLDLVIDAEGIASLDLPKSITLRYVGDERTVELRGRTSTGRVKSLAGSASWTLRSHNSNVVSIGQGGTVLATGPGETVVTAEYRGDTVLEAAVTIKVFRGQRGDLNSDGQVDQIDLDVLRTWVNDRVSIASDARDLNGDGQINALDQRILVTLCSRPRCAVN